MLDYVLYGSFHGLFDGTMDAICQVNKLTKVGAPNEQRENAKWATMHLQHASLLKCVHDNIFHTMLS